MIVPENFNKNLEQKRGPVPHPPHPPTPPPPHPTPPKQKKNSDLDSL